jgi:hypothetical protein
VVENRGAEVLGDVHACPETRSDRIVLGVDSMTLTFEAAPTGLPSARFTHGDGNLRELGESALVVAVSLALFFTVSMLLDFRYEAFDGDAIARMANGFYMIHSRDPHLAAIGFVWNPLSSIADLPLLAFNSFWPTLASHDVAGTTMSALAMACATYQLHAILREWGVAQIPRLVLTGLFVVNPLILLLAGNGMSEAIYLFTMIAATRYLLRWLRAGELTSLAYCAIALALGYLERSEPVAAAMLAAILVFWTTFARTVGDSRSRARSGLTDVAILLVPIVTAFLGWAATSWIIIGQPFPQFASKYGNAALLTSSHQIATTFSDRLVHEVKAIAYISPFFVVIVTAAVVVAIRRKNIQLLGVLGVLGGGIAFTLASYATNAIFPWFRYYALLVPIVVLLVGSMFAVPGHRREPSPDGAGVSRPKLIRRNRPEKVTTALGAGALAILLLAPSLVGTAFAMDDMRMAPDILLYYGFIYHGPPNHQDQRAQTAYSGVRSIADFLDSQHFVNGDVVVDTADNCMPNVVTNVDNPRMFVVRNDRDFERVLNDPLQFHARYLLVQGSASSQADAVGQRYPNLGSGSRWATLVHTFPPRGLCVAFRLFRVIGHPPGTT